MSIKSWSRQGTEGDRKIFAKSPLPSLLHSLSSGESCGRDKPVWYGRFV